MIHRLVINPDILAASLFVPSQLPLLIVGHDEGFQNMVVRLAKT
jgi:hypothetical protein